MIRSDDPRVVRTQARFDELAEQLARDPKVRARLEDVAANSRSERKRRWARRTLAQLEAEWGPVTETGGGPLRRAHGG